MSSPATSCSRRYTDNASTYCSRNRDSTIASRNDLIPRFSVYQLGRGSEPVIVVGRIVPAVAFSISVLSFQLSVVTCHLSLVTWGLEAGSLPARAFSDEDEGVGRTMRGRGVWKLAASAACVLAALFAAAA